MYCAAVYPKLNTSLLRRDIQIPINPTIVSISLSQPFVRLLEMATVKLRSISDSYHTSGMCIRTNPRAALNGLGCTLCKILCLTRSTFATLFAAGDPHARNTTPRVRCFATMSITFCVNFSQPLFAWLLASPALTVRHVFKSSTPLSAHGVRRPPLLAGGAKSGYSFFRSL